VKLVGFGLRHTDFAARDELFVYRCHVCLATKALQPQGERDMLTLIFLRYHVMAATQGLHDAFTESQRSGEGQTENLPTKIGTNCCKSSRSRLRIESKENH
jgi:hypothetical protein